MIEKFKPKRLMPYNPNQGDLDITFKVLRTLYDREELKSELIDSGLLTKLRNPDLFGFNPNEVQAANRVVTALMERSSLDIFELDPVLKALSKTKAEIVKKPRNLPRLTIPRIIIQSSTVVKTVIAAIPLLVLGNCTVYPTYYYNFTEEGRAAGEVRAAEIAVRETAEKEQKVLALLEYERHNTLGVESSSPSMGGWRISYAPLEPDIRYLEVLGENRVKNHPSGEQIFHLKKDEKDSPGVRVNFYTRSDGQIVPLLEVITASSTRYDSTANRNVTTENIEKWILKPEPDSRMDTSVVKFENTETRVVKYLSIRKPKADAKNTEIAYRERVAVRSNS